MRRSAEGQSAPPPCPLAPGLSLTEREGDSAAPKGGGEEARRGIHARPLLAACLLRRQCGERREGPLVLERLALAGEGGLCSRIPRRGFPACARGAGSGAPGAVPGGAVPSPPRAPLSCWGRPRPPWADLPPASRALRGGTTTSRSPFPDRAWGEGAVGPSGGGGCGGCFGVPGSPARLRGGLPLQVPRQELGRGSCAELPDHLWESPVGLWAGVGGLPRVQPKVRPER